MANIVKLQDDLKGIPLKNLIMYVQNPNGQVPSYLALSEIKRRKDMEQRAMAEQNAPAHLSVAEELTAPRQNIGPQFDTPQSMMAAQKQPQQGIPSIPPQQLAQGGIADLDPGNMYDDKNYASGGIVAFADGGDTEEAMNLDAQQALNLDDRPSLNVNTGEQGYGGKSYYMTPDGSGMYAGKFFKDAYRQSPNPLFKLFSQLPNDTVFTRQMAEGGEVKHFDVGGTSKLGRWWEGYKQRGQENLAIEDEIQKLQNEYYSLTVDPFKKTLPGQPEAATQKQAEIKQRINELKAAKADKSSAVSKAPTTIPGAGVMGSQAAAEGFAGTQYDPSQSLGYKGPPLKSVREPGAPGVYDQEKVRDIGDYAKELQDYLGPDKNLNLQRERLAKMEDRATRMEQDAPWLALAEAGFGAMAGTSPFALTNIGAGAQMGLKSYAAARDKFAALEEKRLNLVMNMDQAERREKIASAEFGAKSKQAAEERNFKRNLQREHDKVLMAMNTDDNIKALMAAEIKSQPDINQTLKLNDYVESRLPQEEKLILEDLGGNANVKGTKNYSEYLKRREQAKAKLATQGRTIPGMSVVSGSPVTTPRAKFLGFE
jgi:hypothetical protein